MNIIYCPCKDLEEAKKIARVLVEKKLSVCVNVIPQIYSISRWEGKIEEGEEAVLIIKTLEKLLDKTITEIKKIHSYKVPVIISWKIDTETKEVHKWLIDELIFR
jgi:periplasmic divalent cation tolerance protein